MTNAQIVAGILRGTWPDFMNVRYALERAKRNSDIDDVDDIDAYANSVSDSDEFSVSKDGDEYSWAEGKRGDYWCEFSNMMEHYLMCYAADQEVALEWVDNLYAEAEQERKDTEAEDEMRRKRVREMDAIQKNEGEGGQHATQDEVSWLPYTCLADMDVEASREDERRRQYNAQTD